MWILLHKCWKSPERAAYSNTQESTGSCYNEKSFLPSCFEIRREGFLWIQQTKKLKAWEKPSL